MDNASGTAMMLDIARHYAAMPQARRPRTLVFLTTADHHHGSAGVQWVRDNYDFSKVALIVNSEHPSQTLLYNLDAGLMTATRSVRGAGMSAAATRCGCWCAPR
jgi:Zn-dependent M28 family amino/carboxypeptidase